MTTETTLATHDAGRRPAPRRPTKRQAGQIVIYELCARAIPVGREVVWCDHWHQYRAAALERRCEAFKERRNG